MALEESGAVTAEGGPGPQDRMDVVYVVLGDNIVDVSAAGVLGGRKGLGY